VLLVGALLTVIGGVRLVGWGGPARTVRYLAAGLLAVALVWLGWELATGSSLTLAGVTKRAWVVTFAVVVVGSVADTLFDPSGTVFGIAAAAAYLATRTRSRGLTATLLLLAVVLLGLTVASLADIAGIDVSLSNDGGGAVRAMALGVLLMIVGLGARCEQVAARAT
jgi:hypothetical protein